LIKKKSHFLLLGVVISVIFGIVMLSGFDNIIANSNTEIKLGETSTEIYQEPTTQTSPSINNPRITKIPNNNFGPMSEENLITNQIGTEIGSNIFQECGRDHMCAYRAIEDLSKYESQDVVIYVANYIPAQWEKEDRSCHEIAHHVGKFLLGYYDGDLPKALSSIKKNVCGNALYHAVAQNYIPLKEILDDVPLEDLDIATPCKEVGNPKSSNAVRQCVHGMGHGLAIAYDYDVFKAVKRCEAFAGNEDLYFRCGDGIFMQNHNQYFDDTGLGAYKEDDILYPCNYLEEKYQEMCYQYQGNIILSRNNFDYSKTFEICDGLPYYDAQTACVRTVSQYMAGFFFSDDLDKIVEMCNDENLYHIDSCIFSAVFQLTLNVDMDLIKELCPLFKGEQKEYCEESFDYVLKDNELI